MWKRVCVVLSLAAVRTPAAAQRPGCEVFVREGLVQHLGQLGGTLNETTIRTAFTRLAPDSVAPPEVSAGPYNFGSGYTIGQIRTIARFLSAPAAGVSEDSARTIAAFVDPQMFGSAESCWRLAADEHVTTQVALNETDWDEVTLVMTHRPPAAGARPVTFDGVDVPPGSGITCTGELITTRAVAATPRSVTCRRPPATTMVTNASGNPVRARSALVMVRTSAGVLPIVFPEIPGTGTTFSDGTPVGTVVAWWMPRGAQVPQGWVICDGRTINVPGSPLNGRAAPNLVDRFLMGVRPDSVGSIGGRNDIPVDGEHNHGGNTTTIRYAQGPVSWTTVDQYESQYSHTHAISPDGRHNHGGENRPAFVGLVMIMKVLPDARR